MNYPVQNTYSVSEVAKILEVTPRTVINLIYRSHFPNAHKVDPSRSNSHYRIPKSDLEDYLHYQRSST
jgi:excisionase family DNA binding protein